MTEVSFKWEEPDKLRVGGGKGAGKHAAALLAQEVQLAGEAAEEARRNREARAAVVPAAKVAKAANQSGEFVGDKQVLEFACDASFMQGREEGHLDRHVMVKDLLAASKALKMPLSLEKPVALFSIYDGHFGTKCSEFAAQNFHKKLLPLGRKLYLVQLGSGGAMLSEGDGGCRVFAAGELDVEEDRIRQAGGQLLEVAPGVNHVASANFENRLKEKPVNRPFGLAEEYRIQLASGLGCTLTPPMTSPFPRALGDRELKPIVSVKPEVHVLPLEPNHRAFTLYCDGIAEDIDVLLKSMPGQEKGAPGRLTQDAYNRGSEQNLTAITVFFRFPAKRSHAEAFPEETPRTPQTTATAPEAKLPPPRTAQDLRDLKAARRSSEQERSRHQEAPQIIVYCPQDWPIPFDWREDENTLIFVLSATGVKAKNLSVAICDVYVKVNLPPALFEVDLLHEIDPEHPKTRCRVSPDKVTVTLQKRTPQIWGEFRASGTKAELRARRQAALEQLELREAERLKKRQDFKEEMLKHGEHAQWRLDSQNRETIEKWEQEEKEKWEEEVYRSFDADTGDLLDTQQSKDSGDLDEPDIVEVSTEVVKLKEEVKEPIWTEQDFDDTEEYFPDVRECPGKIGLRFTARPRPGVPVRDRGRLVRVLKCDCRPEACSELWQALKLGSNARCFANRAVASLYLGNFEQCLEDGNILSKPRNGELHHNVDPEDEKVRARVEIRMGSAFLWLGAFKKAEAHFEKALSTEGLDADEIKQVRADLERVRSAYAALRVKEQADQSLRKGDSED
eukprot:g10816.t1